MNNENESASNVTQAAFKQAGPASFHNGVKELIRQYHGRVSLIEMLGVLEIIKFEMLRRQGG